MNNQALVAIHGDDERNPFLCKINQLPFLSQEEEFELARRYHDHDDIQAAHQLVSSYLRYVVRIAKEYQNYGLRIMDLVQEGSIGLMQAVKKFDPYKGFRLATYAIWWIRAAIQEFILKSYSLVRIGTTVAQRKLFFSLRKCKKNIDRLDAAEAQAMGLRLGVSERDVLEMETRLMDRDQTLNQPLIQGGEEWQNLLADPRDNQETLLLERETSSEQKNAVRQALELLDPRERLIVEQRILRDNPITLEELSQTLSISRERVRQLEERAIKKMRSILEKNIQNMA